MSQLWDRPKPAPQQRMKLLGNATMDSEESGTIVATLIYLRCSGAEETSEIHIERVTHNEPCEGTLRYKWVDKPLRYMASAQKNRQRNLRQINTAEIQPRKPLSALACDWPEFLNENLSTLAR